MKLFRIISPTFILVFIVLALIFASGYFIYSLLRSEGETVNEEVSVQENEEAGPLQLISWIPYWDQERAFATFQENVSAFDYLGLFWYRLEPDGEIVEYDATREDTSIISFAKENDVKVLALVANLPDFDENGSWDYRRVDRVIGTTQARRQHVEDLVSLSEELDFDGIVIDYEALRTRQREDFTMFIEELADALHQRGKILGVAIHPKTSEDNPLEDNGSHAQDLERLGKASDHMYVMTYDEHNVSTSPGPISSLNWMRKVVNYAQRLGVAPEKIFLGIPLYAYSWPESEEVEAEGLEYEDIENLISRHDPDIQLSETSGESRFTYQENGLEIEVWFNDAKAVIEKIELAKEMGLGGVNFWRIGQEDPRIWENLELSPN